jgi:ABC-type nitrate/sulfonate/bicarbonate transport system substrate-binding protein
VYDSLGRRFALGSWFARREWIEKNPALVQSFVSAIYATARKVNADQSAIDTYLAAYSKIPVETIRTIVKPVWAELSERSNLDPSCRPLRSSS